MSSTESSSRAEHQAAPAFGELPPPGPLVAPDILCRSCSYELKGIAMAAACPECGAPVANSMRGDMLEAASPGYVRSLRLGALLAEISMPLMIGGMAILFAMFLSLSMQGAGTVRLNLNTEASFNTLAEFLWFLAACLSLAGWWLLTQPDAGGRDIRVRRTLRTLIVIRAIGAVLGLLVVSVPAIQHSPFSVFTGSVQVNSGNEANTYLNHAWQAAIGLRLFFYACSILEFFVACIFLRAIASRIPSARLAKHAKRASWLIPLGWTVGFVPCLVGLPAAVGYYVWMLDLTRRELRGVLRAQMSSSSVPRSSDRLSP